MKKELKLYVMDCSYYGMIIVAATSQEDAREKMRNNYNYCESNEIECFDFDADFEYCNLGDT